MLDKRTLEALVRAAHNRQTLAVVHVGSEHHARDAILAGADGLVHLFVGSSASPDFGQFAASHRVFIVPTLSTLYSPCGMSEGPALVADERLRRFIRPSGKGP